MANKVSLLLYPPKKKNLSCAKFLTPPDNASIILLKKENIFCFNIFIELDINIFGIFDLLLSNDIIDEYISLEYLIIS